MPDTAQAPVALTKPRIILVRGVNWLGDAVMTIPALRSLRGRFPDAKLVLATRRKLASLWEGQPWLDEVVTIDAGESPSSVGRRLKAQQPDIALIFPNSLRSALELWWSGAPSRIGFGSGLRRFLLTHRVPARPEIARMVKRSKGELHRLIRRKRPRRTWPSSAHQVHEYLHLVSWLGADPTFTAPVLHVSRERVRMVASKLGLDGPLPGARPLFGLNPGAEYGAAKRWPTDRFVQVAVDVHRRLNCVWLLTGGPGDASLTSQMDASLAGQGVPVVNAVGKTSLADLCAAFRLCRVLLTNDTGPMHVAAAVGTPVVVPFGSTSPELTGPGIPGDPRHKLLFAPEVSCAPCFLRECPIDFRCMKALAPERIIQAVLAAAAAT